MVVVVEAEGEKQSVLVLELLLEGQKEVPLADFLLEQHCFERLLLGYWRQACRWESDGHLKHIDCHCQWFVYWLSKCFHFECKWISGRRH